MSRRTKQRKRFSENNKARNDGIDNYLLAFKNAIEKTIEDADITLAHKERLMRELNDI